MAAVHMHNFENISAAEEILHINHAVYKSIERNVCAHVLSMCTITCINKITLTHNLVALKNFTGFHVNIINLFIVISDCTSLSTFIKTGWNYFVVHTCNQLLGNCIMEINTL